jgi:hypothetical protein
LAEVTLAGMRYVIVIVVFGLQHVVESCLDSITVTSRGQVAIAVVRYDGSAAIEDCRVSYFNRTVVIRDQH